MPYASGQGLHQIDTPLSNLSVRYANESSAFIATSAIPQVPVAKETDAYYVYGRDHFRIPETIRANKAPANEAEYTLSTSTYQLERHSLRDLVSDRDRSNADSPLAPDVDAMENLTERILLKKELQAMQTVLTSTAAGNSHSLTSTIKWTTLTTTSDPIGDVSTATTVILQNSGKKPTDMIIGFPIMQGLENHPNILERIKYSERGIISKDIIQATLGISKLHVGEAVYNTAREGAADSMSYIWDTDAWIGYNSPTPSLRTASALKTFFKQDRKEMPFSVKKYRNDEREGDWVEVNSFFVTKPVATSAAYLVRGVN
jgi:hypothetical protein